MGFRERPEYQDWRDTVFRLFGQKCIRCGYAGNIHAHHVMPVNEYPELVFEPTNGVPLCGNCHTEIKGNELAHVDDLKRLQRAILGGETAFVASYEPNESVLREGAYAEPANSEAVGQWFEHSNDSQAIVDFYNTHHEALLETWLSGNKETFLLCCKVVLHMRKLERWQDELEFSEKTILYVERVGILEANIEGLACCKVNALEKLGRFPELIAFLREVVARFSDIALLHYNLSSLLLNILSRAEKDVQNVSAVLLLYGIFASEKDDLPEAQDVLEEAVRHALKAAQLAPEEYRYASCASVAFRRKGDYASALHYGKKALTLASTDESKVDALDIIAAAYVDNGLYADARSYLRDALQIDDCNAGVIAAIASCFYMEGNKREAVRMAKHGLMLDPNNAICQSIIDPSWEGRQRQQAMERRESELLERANAEPSNHEAVESWFAFTKASQAAIDFYNKHYEVITKTGSLYVIVARHLIKLERWQDVIRTADEAMRYEEGKESLEKYVENLVQFKLEALQKLGQASEPAGFLRELAARFPDAAWLHGTLSHNLFEIFDETGDITLLDESLQHAKKAIQFGATDNWAAIVARVKDNYASAVFIGERAITEATQCSTWQNKVDFLWKIAKIYENNVLHGDARWHFLYALQVSGITADFIMDMAKLECGQRSETLANLGLMLKPNHTVYQHHLDILKREKKHEQFGKNLTK